MRHIKTAVLAASISFFAPVFAAPNAEQLPVWQQAQAQQQPLLDTLKELVSIESGSGDREGLDRISQLIFDRLKAMGGQGGF